LEWCIAHGFELVELSPEEPEEEDEDLEDDFPESLGMKRVIEALKAHLWPNLVLKRKFFIFNSTFKTNKYSNNSFQTLK
jgi:hypothetical protein